VPWYDATAASAEGTSAGGASAEGTSAGGASAAGTSAGGASAAGALADHAITACALADHAIPACARADGARDGGASDEAAERAQGTLPPQRLAEQPQPGQHHAARALGSARVVCHGGGVVCMHGALNEQLQRLALADCLQRMTVQHANGGTLGDKPPPTHVWCYGYPQSRLDAIRESRHRPACLDIAKVLLLHLGQQQQAQQLREADARERDERLHLVPLLSTLSFRRIWARLYNATTALGWHFDVDEASAASDTAGWVVNVNLGADATFAWRHGGTTHRAVLSSGDAIVFQGHLVEHALEGVDGRTSPPFWREVLAQCGGFPGAAGQDFLRVGVQVRP
jgi:hypothetical protein